MNWRDFIVRWNATDLEKYKEAKQYIDTVIIPLQKFQIEQETKLAEEAFQREVLSLFSFEIERELSGRVLLTPEFNYISSHLENEIERLNQWIVELTKQPFKTVILMTFDANWNKFSENINGKLLWVPSIHTGDINSPEMKTIINGQIQQISELIRSYWE